MFSEETDWGDEDSSTTELHSTLFSKEQTSPVRGKKKKSAKALKTDPLKRKRTVDKVVPVNEDTIPREKNVVKVELKRYSSKKSKKSLQTTMRDKLRGARFRWINEQLYTTTGKQAKRMFEQDPELFSIYHEGFASQAEKWPIDPLHTIIENIECLKLPPEAVIADFGCGEARLAQSLSNIVYSFDLVAANDHVTACDMANVPLPDGEVDVCVFCLSLMGTNVSDFIKEARRVVKEGGRLLIMEIVSRLSSISKFLAGIESHGFKLDQSTTYGCMFQYFEFTATVKKPGKEAQLTLKPCIYKKR